MPHARLGLPQSDPVGLWLWAAPQGSGTPLGSKVSVSPSPPFPAVLLSIPGVLSPSPRASPWQGLGLELSLHPLTTLCGAPGLRGAVPVLACLLVTALVTRC